MAMHMEFVKSPKFYLGMMAYKLPVCLWMSCICVFSSFINSEQNIKINVKLSDFLLIYLLREK